MTPFRKGNINSDKSRDPILQIMRELFILLRMLTLTYLSHPQDTMMGLALLGENLTQETQSACVSSWMVYLHWAKVFHSLMLLSLDPDTI